MIREKQQFAVVIFVKILLMCIRHQFGLAGTEVNTLSTRKFQKKEWRKLIIICMLNGVQVITPAGTPNRPIKAWDQLQQQEVPMNVQAIF